MKGSSSQFLEEEIKQLIKDKLNVDDEDMADYALRVGNKK